MLVLLSSLNEPEPAGTVLFPSSPEANILDRFEQWTSEDDTGQRERKLSVDLLGQINEGITEGQKNNNSHGASVQHRGRILKGLFSDDSDQDAIWPQNVQASNSDETRNHVVKEFSSDGVEVVFKAPKNRLIIQESSPYRLITSSPNKPIVSSQDNSIISSPTKPIDSPKVPTQTSYPGRTKRSIDESNEHKKSSKPIKTTTSLLPIDISDPISSDSAFSSPLKPAKKPKTKAVSSLPYTAKELTAANRTFRKKEDILSEMILNIPIHVYDTFDEEAVKNTVTQTQIRKTYSTIPMIFWKRAVKAAYDEKRDVFIPCTQKEIIEKNVVLYYKAPDLMKRIKNDTLKQDIEQAKRDYILEADANKDSTGKNIHVILMIEGYDKYLNRLKTIANRKYTRAVLTQLSPNETPSQLKRSLEEDNGMTVEECEYLINELQVNFQVNIFPVKSHQEALEWMVSFSYTIGSSLYDKFNRNESLANLGRVKPGTDKQTTFMQTIKQFNMMTTPKVEQLYSFYSSLQAIYERYESHGSLGTFGGKNVLPPTVDSAMKKVFLSDDPDAKIHI